jgi:transposase
MPASPESSTTWPEHTRFVGLDIHKERISIAVAESGRSCAVEYLGEISNDPVAIGKLCDRLERSARHFSTRQ